MCTASHSGKCRGVFGRDCDRSVIRQLVRDDSTCKQGGLAHTQDVSGLAPLPILDLTAFSKGISIGNIALMTSLNMCGKV